MGEGGLLFGSVCAFLVCALCELTCLYVPCYIIFDIHDVGFICLDGVGEMG